jgi:uroporphyrinogen-III decarboxylase
MNKTFYTDIAAKGLRAPAGAHLILHAHADHDAIILNGKRLGDVVAETAHRFNCPLAIPLMDLTLEKDALLRACGIPEAEIESHHFAPPSASLENPLKLPPLVGELPEIPLVPRMRATCDAITHIARAHAPLLPIGMCIGPFSLMTKLITDPIMPVFMAGTGLTAGDDPDVDLVERLLALGEHVIHRYLRAQIAAGAKAIFVCEPAANLVYFSPKQQEETGYAIFDKYVMEPMRRFAALLREHNVDLIFHDCGELTNEMVRRFGTLNPAIISFGSSRKLWEDTAFLPKDTVIYGNLPSKNFYAAQLTTDAVAAKARELLEKMRATGHPFILGTECDVLSVAGSEAEIMSKVDAFMKA